MRIVLLFVLLGLPLSSARAAIAFSEANGAELESAIVITGSHSAGDAYTAELAWINQHRPGCEAKEHAHSAKDGKSYDIFIIQCKTGFTGVWFDATALAGKN